FPTPPPRPPPTLDTAHNHTATPPPPPHPPGTTNVTLTATAVNDAPAGADHTVTTPQNTDYVFGVADFPLTDPKDNPPNALAAVRITTLATAGTLKYNGASAVVGQVVTVADLNAGKLVFSPATGATGTPYATFTFQVQDNGGPLNGGVALDQSPNAMTINVAAVVSIAKVADGAEPGTPGKLRVTLTKASATDTVISSTVGGTATPGAGNDYTALSGSVTIVTGQTTADIDVTVLDDNLVEPT